MIMATAVAPEEGPEDEWGFDVTVTMTVVVPVGSTAAAA